MRPPEERIRMMKNKLISILSAAALAFAAMPAGFAAADDLEGPDDILTDGSFQYINVEGGYKITKCTATIITEIPAVRNGVAIVAIGENAFAGFTGISDLVIPDSVRTIDQNAFYGCSASSLTLPKNLKSLGEGAFSGCTSLTKVTIPDSLTEIPKNAFSRCFGITELDLGSGVTKVDDFAFYECTQLEKLSLPPSLTEIGDMAFAEMLSLSEISADGNSVFRVGSDGILTDTSRHDIYLAPNSVSGDLIIPDGTAIIKPGAFSACAGIEHLFLPSSVTEIGEGAFACLAAGENGMFSSLRSIDFANGLETIGDYAFAYNMLESLSFPTTLKTIGKSAFNGSYALSRVIIPDGVKSIGEKAFFYCDNLRKVTVPKSVSSIGDYAFGFTWENTGSTDTDGAPVLKETKLGGFKMSVPSGSEAKKYAKKNNISYSVTDHNILKWAFIVLCIALLAGAVVFGLVLMSRSRKKAPRRVRKSQKREKEKAEEESYQKIISDENDSQEPKKNSPAKKKPSPKAQETAKKSAPAKKQEASKNPDPAKKAPGKKNNSK